MAAILVVDDDPGIRQLLSFDLTRAGHRVMVAADGRSALRLVDEDPPDLAILDVMMPGEDGFSVLTAMKAGLAGAEVPVIMLTARSEPVLRARGGIEGAVRYVTKPFSPAALRALIDEVLADGPEPDQRRRAARRSLAELAAAEATREAPTDVRPHLTRYELHREPPGERVRVDGRLTLRQRQLLDAVLRHPDVSSAAAELGVASRTVYASLDRAAERAGYRSGPDLVRSLRDERAPA